jgi:hypothetical protein
MGGRKQDTKTGVVTVIVEKEIQLWPRLNVRAFISISSPKSPATVAENFKEEYHKGRSRSFSGNCGRPRGVRSRRENKDTRGFQWDEQ